MTELPKYKSKKLKQLTSSSELAVLKIKKLQAEIDHLTRQNQLRHYQIVDILDSQESTHTPFEAPVYELNETGTLTKKGE
jgi:hypothetical protein